MEKWDRIVIRNGNPVMLGANKNEEGMNFAAEVLPGAEAALVLYQKGSAVPCREIPFTERMGKVCTMLVSGLNTKKYEYNFRIDGKSLLGLMSIKLGLPMRLVVTGEDEELAHQYFENYEME